MRTQFDYTILDAINNAIRTVKASPLILGGVSGSGGGAGGPVGGFVGYLPQYRVAYDTDELAMSGFLQPGAIDEDGYIVSGSLLDNLNHIRWRLSQLEAGSGSVGASSFLDLTDTPNSYATFSGYVLMVNPAEDGLEFGLVTASGGGGGTPGGSDTQVQYNNGGAFGGDAEFTWDDVTKALGIGDPADLPAISPDHTFWMTGDGVSPSQFMVSYGSTFAPFVTFMKADGSAASPANVKNNQVIGRIRGRGHDGSGWTDTRIEIRIVADGDWGVNDTPTRIELWTCPDGSGTLTLAMTIGSDGNINIATGKTYNINGSPHTHSYIPSDGWIEISEMWTRTGNHTFTVSGDLTAKYKKGRFVRYRDGGSDEYGVIQSSSHAAGTTTVTLVTNTDYAMAAATITDTYIAISNGAEGLPKEFNFTPSFTNLTLGNASVLARWANDLKSFRVHVILGSTSSVGTVPTMATPFPTPTITGYPRIPIGIATYLDTSPLGTTLGNVVISTADTVLLQVVNAGGTYATISALTSTIPFTWATSDEISFFGVIPS